MTVVPTAAEIAEDRAEAESRMLDTFDIKMPTGEEYDDDPASPTYGEEVTTYDHLFTTKARLKVIGAYGFEQQVAGRTVTEIVRELHIPVSSPEVPVGAHAIPVTLADSTDQTVAGGRLVLEPSVGSQTTARRMKVREVLS